MGVVHSHHGERLTFRPRRRHPLEAAEAAAPLAHHHHHHHHHHHPTHNLARATDLDNTDIDSEAIAGAAPAPPHMPSTKSLRVLCLGDSLTWGFTNGGQREHPYSLVLRERLAAALPHTRLEVITNGANGDVASFARFANRLRMECDKRWFDWVIILAGTNDLGYGIDGSKIYEALTKAWDVPLSKNSKVLALTVPECGPRPASLEARRNALNELILSHVDNNFHSYDLKSKIPYHSLSKEDREKYWDDHLHMTSDGYDLMGGFVADALLQCIAEEENEEKQSQSAMASQHYHAPSKTGDDAIFEEEEDGNPKHISQGYVVVRKQDLH